VLDSGKNVRKRRQSADTGQPTSAAREDPDGKAANNPEDVVAWVVLSSWAFLCF
jgi:hypothetical protein